MDDLTSAAARTTLGAVGLTGNDTITGTKDLTGATVTVATATAGDNDTTAASTAFVQTALSNTVAVADTDANPTAATRIIRYTSLTASREINLPAASAVPAGLPIDIIDASGSASSTVTLSLDPDGSDTIAGSNATQVCVNVPRGRCRIVSNGTNGWDVLEWSVVYEAIATGDTSSISSTFLDITGISVAQGTVGTWEVEANVTMLDTAGSAQFFVKITDGTSDFAASSGNSAGLNGVESMFMRARVTSPAGNLKAQAKNATAATGVAKFNASGTSKDTYIRAWRVA